jgi:hypothetical protein
VEGFLRLNSGFHFIADHVFSPKITVAMRKYCIFPLDKKNRYLSQKFQILPAPGTSAGELLVI